MSERTRSFFSTIPGLVTGLAGLLTGIVGLVTVLIQLNVIGGDDSNNVATTGTTVAPAGGGGAGAATTAAAGGRITVDPASLKLAPTEREKTLTVRNEGPGPLTVLPPEFDGTDKTVFRTDAGCTNKRLEAGRSCTLKVLFTPGGPLKSYSAKLVLKGEGATRVTEVPVDATTLLG